MAHCHYICLYIEKDNDILWVQSDIIDSFECFNKHIIQIRMVPEVVLEI